MNNNKTIYFISFGAEHIPKEIKKFIKNKKIVTNIYRMQAYDSMMYGYLCIGFTDYVLNSQSLLDYKIYFFIMVMRRMIKEY